MSFIQERINRVVFFTTVSSYWSIERKKINAIYFKMDESCVVFFIAVSRYCLHRILLAYFVYMWYSIGKMLVK